MASEMTKGQPVPEFADDWTRAQIRIAELEAELGQLRAAEPGLQIPALRGSTGACMSAAGAPQVNFQADILEATNDAVVALDTDLNICYCNRAAEQLYGVKLNEVAGKPMLAMHGYAWLNKEDELRSISDLAKQGSWTGEYIHILNDGSQIVVNSTVNVLPEHAGGGMVAIIRNVTGRKQAELQTQNQAVQLARANNDLLHFAYAVSHDLQTPLRTVTSFAQLLAMKYKQKLDAQGSEFIRFIVDASARMDAMLRDLLQFAKVAGGEAEFTGHVSLQGAFQTALSGLKSMVDETEAVVSAGELPVVEGDEGQLVQLFQNLIGNSLKYWKPQIAPRIHVSAERAEGFWTITVRDNGLGFDPKNAERIFGVFQRLHGKEVAGTGIGLTICKRIVERRGGRIWAESEPGQGAAFHFSVPDSVERIRSEPSMTWADVRRSLEVERVESGAPKMAHHFDEVFKTLDLAQAIVRKVDGTIMVWTKGAENLFGWSESEALGKRLNELIQPELPPSMSAAGLEAALLGNGEWTGELKAFKRNGEPVWLAVHKVLYRDGAARPQSVIEVHTDITALKQAEEALRRSSEQCDLALSVAKMGVWRWDSHTGVAEWSETLEALLGMPPGSLEGTLQAMDQRVHPDDREELKRSIEGALRNGSEYTVENRLLHASGKYIWVQGQGRVIHDRRNEPAGLIGVVWDINERRQREEDRQFLLDLGTKLAGQRERQQLTSTTLAEVSGYLSAPASMYAEVDVPGKRFFNLSEYYANGPASVPERRLADGFHDFAAEIDREQFVAVNDVETDTRPGDSRRRGWLARRHNGVPGRTDGAGEYVGSDNIRLRHGGAEVATEGDCTLARSSGPIVAGT